MIYTSDYQCVRRKYIDNNVLISIVTVTYNCADSIRRTIESVKEQNDSGFEYIIVDGGSSDGTCDIINDYISYITHYISEKDFGIYDAMNKGIKLSSGNYILFLGGDDCLLNSNTVRKMTSTIRECKSDIISCDVLLEGHSFFGPKNIEELYIQMVPHQGVLAKRECLIETHGFDERFKIAADYDWLLKTLRKGASISFVQEPIVWFSGGGVSSKNAAINEAYIIAKENLCLLGKMDLVEKLNQTYRKKIRHQLLLDAINLPLKGQHEILMSALKNASRCVIWGKGVWSDRLIRLMRNNEIAIEYIIDNNAILNHSRYNGLEVVPYDSAHNDAVIVIATWKYEEEIEKILKRDGKIAGEDYISFSDLEDIFVENSILQGRDDWIDIEVDYH